MKRRSVFIVLVLAALGLAVGLSGCGGSSSSSASPTPTASPTAAQTVKVDAPIVPAAVDLKVGDKLVVVLNSNASTGYLWSASGMNTVSILQQVGKAVVTSGGGSGLVGAPGKTKFIFSAVKTGTDQLEFWYARPSDPASPGAAYALVVNVAKGHLPQTVNAGEDYTAETAQLRTGDTLQVTIRHASYSGKATWKTVAGSTPLLKSTGPQKFSTASDGTVTMEFAAKGTGNGTLVLVNQPAGEPPLQTYSLPVIVKQGAKPITYQVNQNDAGETFSAKVGDLIQVALPEQPSTDFAWQWVTPKSSIIQQVGKPKFVTSANVVGAKGKMVWTFQVVGQGTASMIADYNQIPAQATPIDSFQFTVAAKGGAPKVVQAVDSYPANTVFLTAGDKVAVDLPAGAGVWKPQGAWTVLPASVGVMNSGRITVTYTAKAAGIAIPLLLAKAPTGLPSQAYAFTAQISASTAKTVTAAEHQVAKAIDVSVGQTFDVTLPGSPTSGYMWATDAFAQTGIVEQAGPPTIVDKAGAGGAAMGDAGTVTMHYKAVGAGSVPLVILYETPGTDLPANGIWMTMVNVK